MGYEATSGVLSGAGAAIPAATLEGVSAPAGDIDYISGDASILITGDDVADTIDFRVAAGAAAPMVDGVVLVSDTYGSDGTGAVDNLAMPFKTLAAGVGAVGASVVLVDDGTYVVADLAVPAGVVIKSWSGKPGNVILDMATAVAHGLVLAGNNKLEGVQVINFGGTGFSVRIDGADTVIEDNDFQMLATFDAIQWSATATNTRIVNNKFARSGAIGGRSACVTGVAGADGLFLQGNTISDGGTTDNVVGITGAGSNIRILGNRFTFAATAGNSSEAIELTAALLGCEIADNKIRGGTIGIGIVVSSDMCKVYSNTVDDVLTFGLQITAAGSDLLHVHDNNIRSTTASVVGIDLIGAGATKGKINDNIINKARPSSNIYIQTSRSRNLPTTYGPSWGNFFSGEKLCSRSRQQPGRKTDKY